MPRRAIVVTGYGQSMMVLLSGVTQGHADSTCELSCVVVSTTESDCDIVTVSDTERDGVRVALSVRVSVADS